MKRACFELIGFALMSLWGCSDRNLSLDEEMGGIQPGDETDDAVTRWSCLANEPGYLPFDRAAEGPEATITYVVRVGGTRPDVFVTLLDLKVCTLADVYCSTPLNVPIEGPGGVARFGEIKITLPYGFEGYLQLFADYYQPTHYYFQGPVVGSPDGETTIYGEPIVLSDAPALGETDVGSLLVRTIDCFGSLSDGVRLELLGASASGWVTLNGLMVQNTDGSLTTDASGIAGFSSIPAPATVIVEGVTRVDCDPRMPEEVTCPEERRYGRMATRVQPGVVTIAELRPDYTYGR